MVDRGEREGERKRERRERGREEERERRERERERREEGIERERWEMKVGGKEKGGREREMEVGNQRGYKRRIECTDAPQCHVISRQFHSRELTCQPPGKTPAVPVQLLCLYAMS